MTNEADSYELTLEPVDNERLANLCGQFDEHLRLIEARLGVEISNRGNHFHILSGDGIAEQTGTLLRDLYASTKDTELTPNGVHLQLQESDADALEVAGSDNPEELVIRTRRGSVRARGPNQRRYLQRILDHDINFGVGPAGTGKTYLAVACAVDALERDRVRRIVLVRPAVEAGERLGFLPGDMAQKIDPYLRPLYDALYEMLGFERVAKLMDRDVIEVAPLAFMRGRTLNESFIILDEAQNTSKEQMKMFLTPHRIRGHRRGHRRRDPGGPSQRSTLRAGTRAGRPEGHRTVSPSRSSIAATCSDIRWCSGSSPPTSRVNTRSERRGGAACL